MAEVSIGAIVAGVSALVGAGTAVKQSNDQKKTAKEQMQVQKELAAQNEKAQQEALLSQDRQKSATDIGALMASNFGSKTNVTGGSAGVGSGQLGGNKLLG